jgi:hypothetical protein
LLLTPIPFPQTDDPTHDARSDAPVGVDAHVQAPIHQPVCDQAPLAIGFARVLEFEEVAFKEFDGLRKSKATQLAISPVLRRVADEDDRRSQA